MEYDVTLHEDFLCAIKCRNCSFPFRFGGNTSRFHDLYVEATGDIKFRATHQYKYASDARLKYLSHLVLLTRERERFSICEFDDFHFGHQWYIE